MIELGTTVNLESATLDAAGRGRQSPSSPRVLVASTQPANVQLVGSLLGRLGCEVIPAFDGRMALKRLALRQPDLILLDPLLPRLNGIDTCRRIRRSSAWRHIPIVFISTADDPALIARALAAGGADYIKQPCSLVELAGRLKIQLERKHNFVPTARSGGDWTGPAEEELITHLRELKIAVRPVKLAKDSHRTRLVGGIREWRKNISKLGRKFWIQAGSRKANHTAAESSLYLAPCPPQ